MHRLLVRPSLILRTHAELLVPEYDFCSFFYFLHFLICKTQMWATKDRQVHTFLFIRLYYFIRLSVSSWTYSEVLTGKILFIIYLPFPFWCNVLDVRAKLWRYVRVCEYSVNIFFLNDFFIPSTYVEANKKSINEVGNNSNAECDMYVVLL